MMTLLEIALFLVVATLLSLLFGLVSPWFVPFAWLAIGAAGWWQFGRSSRLTHSPKR